MASIDEDEIAAIAYRLWEEEGRPHGRDVLHWKRAVDLVTMRPERTRPEAGTALRERGRLVPDVKPGTLMQRHRAASALRDRRAAGGVAE